MSNIRKALHLLGPGNRGRWLLLIAIAVGASGFEIVGGLLVYLLLTLIADPGGHVSLPFVGDVQSFFAVEQEILLLGLAIAMGLFFVIRAIVHVGLVYLQNRVAHNAGARLAARVVEGYLCMPYAFHLHRNSSDLIRNGHQAVGQLVDSIFIPLIRVTAEAILVIGMLLLLVVVAPAATGLAIVIVGGTALLLLLVVQPRLKRIGRISHEMERETLSAMQQALHGIRDVKVLGREHSFARRYGRARVRLARARYLRATLTDLPRTVMELALLGFILVVFSLSLVAANGTQGILSVLGLFAYAGLRIQPSLHKIIAGLNNLKFSSAPLDDLHRDLLAMEALEAEDQEVAPLEFTDSISLVSVRYRYPGSERDALQGIDLTVRPGEVIGICGPTGGGKTTLVDILSGLLEPTAGIVAVDGQDLRRHVRAWQRTLGIVPQMVFLTDESLRRNIALGLPPDEIEEDAVLAATNLAQLREFVATLPEGLDTVVGERGVRISGGQRQRIAIARALYRHPKVLIFDEGTSALDNATEKQLMTALEQLRGDHTIFLVAHRLSTVQTADRVMFIQDGRCTGLGTYENLLESHPEFRTLAAT